MFCVECGKKGEIFRDAVCVDCYLKTHSFTYGPKIIDLSICSHCRSYKYKNSWTSDSFDEILKKWIKHLFNIDRELKKIKIFTDCKEEKECIMCKVTITGYLDDIKISEDHNAIVRKKKDVCDVCSKRFGGYHEAIIQLRADNRNLNEKETIEIKNFIETIVKTMQEKGHRSLFITDIGKENRGLDFFLSDKGSALAITKKIQGSYGGEIKKSSKNIGMKDGKQVYRMTYLIRLPIFRKGDFISYEKSFLYISSISGGKIHVLNLYNWIEKVVNIKELNNAIIHGGEDLIKEMIFVSQTRNEIQFMDPITYKTFSAIKPKETTFDSTKIRTVKLNDEIFILPYNIKN
jgi:nonsense-mediated mRNA decay protein 3